MTERIAFFRGFGARAQATRLAIGSTEREVADAIGVDVDDGSLDRRRNGGKCG
jgi:hypothetical protein